MKKSLARFLFRPCVLLAVLLAAGARMAQPGEFTIRAYLAGKIDLAQAEAVADLIASSSRAAHALATTQMRGGYSEELEALRDKLLHLLRINQIHWQHIVEVAVNHRAARHQQTFLTKVVGNIRECAVAEDTFIRKTRADFAPRFVELTDG